MRDKVSILINNEKISEFEQYEIDSQTFSVGNDFSFTLARGLIFPNEGDLIKVFINDDLELTGIIETVDEDDSKQGDFLTISGRDTLSLAVENYVKKFGSFAGKKLEEITRELIKEVDVLNRSSIRVENETKKFDVPDDYLKAELGNTIFDTLSRIATARRTLFFAEPDGTIVFGKIPTEPTEDFKVFRSKEANFLNVIQAKRSRTISGVYSKVIVYGQNNDDQNFKVEATRDDLPFEKTFVGQFNEGEGSAKEQAKSILEDQRRNSFSLSYVVRGHSQNGENYRIRKGVRVTDERFEIDGAFWIVGRTFTGSKSDGQKTSLILGQYAER